MKDLKDTIYNICIYNDKTLRANALPKKVKYPRLVEYQGGRRYSPLGLYDPAIFGYADHCDCPKVRQTTFTGTPVMCPSCHKMVYGVDIYAENYSVYELNAPYISFLKLDALATEYKKVFGSFPLEGMKGTLKDFWSLYVCMDTEKFSNIELENDDGTPNIVEPVEMVDKNGVLYYVAITDLPGKGETDVPKVDYRGKPIDVSNMGLFGLKKLSEFRFTDGMINNVMGDLINQLLMINSPATRELHTVPGSEKNNSQGFPQITVPQETCDYLAIMNYNREIAKYLEMKELSITDKATYCWFMNVLIDKHFQTSEFLAPSKYSTVRTSLDTRVMHSMRAIIVPSEGLMDTIGVPDTFLYATFQKEIVDEIEKYLTNTKTYGDEIIDAKEIYLKRTPLALEIYHKMFEPQIDDNGNEYIPAMAQLVRNPTLHKHNFLAFKIKIVSDTSVHLPIAVDEGYNADHDGDTVAVWIYTNPEDVVRLKQITPEKVWFYDKEFRSPYTPKDEILYGLYMATVLRTENRSKDRVYKSLKEAEEYFNENKLPVNVECIINHKHTTFGRAYLSDILKIDIETFIKCYPQTGKNSKHDEDSYQDEDYLEKLELPKRIKGEPEENYQKRVKKAEDEYNKKKHEIDVLKIYKEVNKYKSMNAIGKDNIGTLMQILATHPNRVEEYNLMQQFGAKIATMVGLGEGLYHNIFTLTQEDINKVLDKKNDYTGDNPDARAMELKAELRDKFMKNITENLLGTGKGMTKEKLKKQFENSNIRELMNSFGKFNINKLMVNYCPTINGDTLKTLNAVVGDSLFEGMSQESYYSNGEQNRNIWVIKQDLVPISGYMTRQYADIALNLLYDDNIKSKDKYGVLIKESNAKGREVIERVKVLEPEDPEHRTGVLKAVNYVRVKSFATKLKSLTDKQLETEESFTVCPDEIGKNFELKINNEKLEIEKYAPNAGSSIGIAFATSVTEHLTQAALGLKHGGDLVKLKKDDIVAPGMLRYIGTDTDMNFLNFEAMEPCLNFKAGDTLTYIVTDASVINNDLIDKNNDGKLILNKGDLIMKKIEAVKPDDVLSRLNTMCGSKAGSETLGKPLPTVESWSISKGKFDYHLGSKTVNIGNMEYKFNKDEVYLYPLGTEIDYAQAFCTGIPNMNKLTDKWVKEHSGSAQKDYGILFAVFNNYLHSLSDFSHFNNEPLEILFAMLCDSDYNVEHSIDNQKDILNRLYFGGATRVVKKAIHDAFHGNEKRGIAPIQHKYDKNIKHLLNEKHGDVELQELTLKNKSTLSPTIRRISISENFEDDYDWKGIMQEMYAEGIAKESDVVKWNWDTVREHLREFKGYLDGNKKQAMYTKSISQCKASIKTSPKVQESINLLKDKLSILDEEYEALDKRNKAKVDELNEKIKLVKKQIKKYEDSESNELGNGFWKHQLEIAKDKYEKVPTKTLVTKLEVWLSKIHFGASLNAYVTVKPTTGISLIITAAAKVSERDEDEIDLINKQIMDLQLQKANAKTDKEIERIDRQIRQKEKDKSSLEYNTVAKIPLGNMKIPLTVILRKRS